MLLCRDGEGRGHTSMTQRQPTFYAGKVFFAQDRMERWNNDTGHYRTEPDYLGQAEVVPVDTMVSPLLPAAKFVPL